jgi:hypothetical protein
VQVLVRADAPAARGDDVSLVADPPAFVPEASPEESCP